MWKAGSNKQLSRRGLLKMLAAGVGGMTAAKAQGQLTLLERIARGEIAELDRASVLDALTNMIDPPGTWGRPEDVIFPQTFFPNGKSSFKVLEVHLYGGLSPWENFYHRNLPNGDGYRGHSNQVSGLNWHASDLQNVPNLCAYTSTQSGANPSDRKFFSRTDNPSGAHDVHFGPATKPLWANGIFDRTRVVVMQHNLLPHEAAVPYSATGFRLGQPSLAGLGAVIQNRALAIQDSASFLLRRTVPWSYVLEKTTSIAMADNIDAYRATGRLGGAAKPVSLIIGGDGIVADLDQREDRTNHVEKDALLKLYRDQFQNELTFPNPQALTRSKGYSDYNAALSTALNAESLAQTLRGSLTSIGNNRFCVTELANQGNALQNAPASGLRSAAALLRHASNPAAYACVIDNGIAGGNDGYDTHGDNTQPTAENLYNTLATLRSLIDSNEINLDDTLIVLNTEFGRTPYPGEDTDGRDHWPQGYVNVLIGGPIQANNEKVLGHIKDGGKTIKDSNNGYADKDNVYNASDVRAAVMLAANIDPFADGLFGGGDVSRHLRGSDNQSTAQNIVNRFFR